MYENQARLFKVLSDPNRIKILELLIKGETCGCTLIDKLSISQPTLSYHLKMLNEFGLTKTVKEGNQNKNYVDKKRLMELEVFIKSLRELEYSCEIEEN